MQIGLRHRLYTEFAMSKFYTARFKFTFLILSALCYCSSLKAQCDVEVSGVLAYCNSFRGNANNTFPGFFIGFRIKSLTGDTLDVVDLAGNNIKNRGKRIDDINTQQEPSDTSRAKVRIAGGVDSLEFWYFGPFMDGDSFNIVLVDVSGECDTVEVASGTFTCSGQDPNACDSKVPLYFLDFSASEWQIGGGGGGNEDFDQVFLIMQRARVETCCHTGNDRCFEFIITLDEDDIGLMIDDVGSGSPGGSLFADSLNGFACGTSQSNTWPYYQDNGQSADEPLCLNASAREWIVLSCKEGGNVTGVSFGTVGSINVLPEYVYSDCTVNLEVLNASSAIWSSPDDPGLNNLVNFTTDSLIATFSYDEDLYGPITSCDGDTFTYYVGGYPDNSCLDLNSLYYDTTFVVVYPGFSILIDSTCTGSNDSILLEAIFSGGAPNCGYTYIWSTGDTTTSITVPNTSGEYSIRVFREDLDSLVRDCSPAVDIIQVEPFSMQCLPDMQFECPSETPPSNTNDIEVAGCGINPLVFTYDVSNNGSGCLLDSLIIDRYYIVDYDGDTINTITDKDTCIQSFVYLDNTPPQIVCPAHVTLECIADTDPSFTGFATSTDNCDLSATITYTDAITNGVCPQEYIIRRTWRSTDDCGNSSTCLQNISITDNTPPVISCPSNITLNCEDSTVPTNTGYATATDICDSNVVPTYTDVVTSSACPRIITRTWRATDDCGNFSTCNQILTLLDAIAPLASCPPDVTIACNASTNPSNTGSATGTDNCDVSLTVTFSDSQVSGSCPQNIIITRTWVVTDDCGNSSTCNQSITKVDLTPPALVCPANVTIQCNTSTLPAQTGTATANDLCDPAVSPTYTDVIIDGDCPNAKTINRTWRAEDDCGNFSTCLQVISITDQIAPVLTCPANITLQCNTNTLPQNTGTASATDNCDVVTPTFSDMISNGSCPQEFIITRTWTAIDGCENMSSCVQTITVVDEIAPVIVCPSNITIDFAESTLPANTGEATATDNCDVAPGLTYTDLVPSNCPQLNVITRTWVATDACGNSSSCQQSILINDHGSICGSVVNDFDEPIGNVQIQLWADVNNNETVDAGDTLITTTQSATGTGNYCFPDIKPCDYVVVEIQPATYENLMDYDITPDPDGNDSIQGPDNEIPVTLQQGELDHDNNFVEIACALTLPVITPDTICSGDSVLFETTPLDPGVLTYTWNFGSGSNPMSGTGLGPHMVEYDTTTENQLNGAIVTLTIAKDGCTDVTGQVSSVDVNAYPNATINASTANICYYANKVFQPLAAPITGATYNWSFGANAVPSTATGYGPHTVYYTVSGEKTVSLAIYPNEAGAQCPDSSSITFNVVNCPGNITGVVKSNLGPGIQGVNLKLYVDANLDGVADTTTPVRSVFTTSNGSYSMVGLTPGSYVIIQTQPTLWTTLDDEDTSNDNDPVPNIDSLDNLIPATVMPSEIDANNTFIEIAIPGSIGGMVFLDANGNEMPDNGEGMAGVTISLYDDDDTDGLPDTGTPTATTVTTSVGSYTFSGISVGNYVVVESQPSGYDSFKDFDSSNDQDSVPNSNILDDIIPVTLTNVEFDDHNYFIDQYECTLMVVNNLDEGPGSLRHMVSCAGVGDTITFDTTLYGDTIFITSAKIVIDNDLVIQASGTPRITIKSETEGLFDIVATSTVSIIGLDIISGMSGGSGAAFYNVGILKLSDVSIMKNPLLPANEYLIFNNPGSQLFIEGDTELSTD